MIMIRSRVLVKSVDGGGHMRLLRAVALNHTDLTDFVLRHSLLAAKAVINEADHFQLSGRDSLRVLDLLEHPPAPNRKLLAAARALPK
jgi:uncharacterized protein (DUF1778 family)